MKVITFGEAIFRLVTSQGERLHTTDQLNFYLGGTELNISANLSSLGIKTSWVTALTNNLTGEMVRTRVNALGIDMSYTQAIEGGDVGWYLMEKGSNPRPDVVFHRQASSLAKYKTFSFDWQKIFQGATLFHTSGVTAGLSVELTAEVEKAMKIARSEKLLVSYDFNYRKNIWTIEEFVSRQKSLIPHIDLLFCAESDLELFFKKDPSGLDYSKIFNGTTLKALIITKRSSDESEYGIDVVTPLGVISSKRHKVQSVDRIGVGDSMAAGFLKSYLESGDLQKSAEWASLAGAMKYGIQGDMALLNEKEMKVILENGSRGILR